MFGNSTVLAIVCARGSSKGLHDKHLQDLCGRPVIRWTIEAGITSRYVDRTVLSTDCPMIAEAGRICGADVPFQRPTDLARDGVPGLRSVVHCVEWIRNNESREYDYVVVLQPTSPLRTGRHVDEAIELFLSRPLLDGETLVSVCHAPLEAGWLMRQSSDEYLDFCFDLDPRNRQRQNLPRYFLPNGAIYIALAANIQHGFYCGRVRYYVMRSEDSIDVDSQEDLDGARIQMESRSANLP